jgi:tRNA A-37 threonylcarbamoyl transferase component Bud32
MNPESQLCPKCGAPIPERSPHGLCPKCLMAAAAATNDTGQATGVRPPPPTREEVAAAFPQLEVIELIGQGGMGAVFKARQPKLDRLVALKILTRSRSESAAFSERFTREGRALARLNHPGIVAVHDFGQADGFYYLVMEYVDGVNLRQAMRAGRFAPEEALAIAPKICEALQFAHNEGVLHRDIKPENILLDAKGRVKIADFGIAKLVGEPAGSDAITESGSRLGTPHYMAPEQMERPGEVDHRADIYSLGVVFYEMLTGELPIGRFAPPSQKSGADPRLDEVVFRTLEKEPSRRQQSAEEVKTQVETISGQANPQATAPDEKVSRLRKMLLLQLLSFAAAVLVSVLCWQFKTADTTDTSFVGTMFVLYGALFFSFGLPLWLRMAPMNSFYGAQFRESFESEERWYEINAYLGVRVMRWSLLIAATGIAGFFLLPGKTYPLHAIWMVLATQVAPFFETKIWVARMKGAKPTLVRRWGLSAIRCVVVATIFAMFVRTFVAQPYRVKGDTLAPELPAGSRCVAWKLARPVVGDILIYERGGYSLLGRVTGAAAGAFTISRNNTEPISVPLEEVVGRIVISTRSQLTLESPKTPGPRLLKAFSPSDPTISKEVALEADKSWVVNSAQTQVVRLFDVPNPGVEDCVVIYRASLKTEGLKGRAYLEMLCRFPEFGEAFSRGLGNTVSGSNDWASYQTPFFLKKGEKPDLIKLNLVVEGVGRVWIKDVELSVGSPSSRLTAGRNARRDRFTILPLWRKPAI